ncbi:2-oxoglutarate (2OG) and Fe(II)-dependent oxygenase superfamily protein [Rhynchospora pubera]|uniref:2-oxoglutarate (2OG) and Fe(II)-dependent oxygenase superfamily protein n=1 Tax=Rhynchospora pubera TaxID=906938 RepID=A0AAV8GQE4_9POAL|nr:2-oxoglutarate (2OG) and Fe(II)-dependent oxygenase superfamily protein [Rhynchospora pubera]
MDTLLSNMEFQQTVPEQFVLPPENRVAGEINTSVSLPVIDLRGGPHCHVPDRDKLIREVLRAGKEFGFFQVINHGVSEQLMKDIMGLTEEFFNMPKEDKAAFYSEDSSKTNRLFSSTIYGKDGPRYWRDCLKLACYPVPETINEWPNKPTKFRDILAKFIVEAREVSMMLLSLICEGLGLKEGYFEGDVSSGQVLINANYYPPCPKPDLTLGLPPHCDRNLITLLLQGDVSGLQIMHQGRWVGAAPIPNAFVVNFGHQLEIITNGILKSVEHRAVTNSGAARMSMAVFIMPTMESFISPAKELTNEENPPLYKSFLFKDFLRIYTDLSAKRVDVMEAFKINV